MGTKNNRGLLVGVLGLAGSALVVDRVLLSGEGLTPDSAAAAGLAVAVEQPVPTIPDLPPEPKSRGSVLAERLRAVEPLLGPAPEHVPNAFGAFFRQPEPEPQPEPVREAAKPVRETASEKFVREHRLHTVMLAGDASLAIVNGTRVALGQQIGGFTLVELRQREALFERNGSRVALTLK